MKSVNVNEFVAMRASLLQERAALESRLAQISRALANQPAAVAAPAVVPAAKPVATAASTGRRKRAKNSMSLHEAVLGVIGAQALTKEQLLAAVLQTGYRFTAKKPANSLGNLLYQKSKFKNAGGKFSPVK